MSTPVRLAVGLLLMAGFGYATRGFTLPKIGHWLDIGQTPQPTDYVMVLNGEPDTRPFAAADLYLRGIAKRILITSTQTDERRTTRPELHDAVHSILIRCGVRESDINLIDSRCSSTFDEANALKAFLSNQPGVTVSVMTNGFHTRRTRWVFRLVLGSQASQVRFVSAKTDQFNASNWWKHEDGFVWYLFEIPKLVFYWLRYGHGLAWIAALLGGLGIGRFLHRRRLTGISPC